MLGRLVGGLGLGALLRLVRQRTSPLALHIYDHCPFCIRVELALGWAGVPYQRKLYGYGDTLGDPDKGLYSTGVALTGKKQLPVLSGPGREPLAESSAIIAELAPGLPAGTGRHAELLSSNGQFKKLQRQLCRPRVVRMEQLTDWARPEDVAYATAKYQTQGFDYQAAVAADGPNKTAMAVILTELDARLVQEGELGWDDLELLPELRTLSCVAGLAWPAGLRGYVEAAFGRAGVPTYFDCQL